MELLEIHLQYSDANYIVMLRSRNILSQVARTRNSLIHSTTRYRKRDSADYETFVISHAYTTYIYIYLLES